MSTDTTKKESPLVERAIHEADADRLSAMELMKAQDVKGLHALIQKLIQERMDLARGIEAMGTAMAILGESRNKPAQQEPNAIAAVERMANEAIGLAREVVKALTAKHGEGVTR